jgi:uncharacterized iron-regulated membrane protein
MRAFLYRPQNVLFRRALFQVHLWTGIVAGLYIFVVCITGAALVFRIDMQRAAHPALFTPGHGPSAHPASVLEQVRDAFPADEVSFVEAPSRLRPVYLAYLKRGNDFPAVLVDPSSGKVLGEVPQHSVIRTLQELHFDLLAGRTGRIANGIGAALLLVLSLTGAVIWWPGLPNWRRSLKVRWTRNLRRVSWDLHSATGFWSVVLIAMWAVTGIYFAFPAQFRDAVNRISPLTVAVPPVSSPSASGAGRTNWRVLVARAQQERPGEHVARMVPPADEKAAFVVVFSKEMPLPGGRADLTPVYLDQYTGAVLKSPDVRRSAGDVVMNWAGWLHTGGFGGNRVRVTWFLLGLAPPLLFATGFTMWWTRVVRPRL